MKSISFGLYNQISNRSEKYQKHIRDITDFAINFQVICYNNNSGNIPQTLISGLNIDDIIEYANKKNTDYCFIVAYGYRSYEHNLAQIMIDYMESNNYSVLAHILQDDPKNLGFYSLHNQCLMINMQHWRQAGHAKFGNYETASVILPEVIRDPNNFHDDYTPGWIYSTGQCQSYSGQLREGWSLISSLLKNGYKIGNFPQEIRQLKHHIYPEVGTELERRLLGEDVEVVEHNQKNYVELMDFRHFQESVYVFNTDPMIAHLQTINYNTTTKIGSLYCVAAGFKPILLLNKYTWDQDTRMVYIDYSQSALNFKKWLVENWDGRNYTNIIEKYTTQVDPNFRPIWFVGKDYKDQWDYTMQIFGGEESWLDIWNRYKKLEHRYLKINLYNDYENLLEDMNNHRNTNNLIWFSNSFYTEACLMNFQPNELENYFNQFIQAIKDNSDSLQICGSNHRGRSAWQYFNSSSI